jgi:hypothetical protein
MQLNKKKATILAIVLVIFTLIGFAFGESIWNIISNILGPYPVHVSSETSQLLTISSSNPPENISLGQTINITLTVKNSISSAVQGYILINITATSNFTANDISATLRGQNFGGWSGEFSFHVVDTIPQGFVYKTWTKFTWESGCADSATLYITFNRQGDYQLTIAVSSN